MYGQQIGKLGQPLDNLVVEEIERDSGLREIHFTIAMKDLPSTAPIAQRVADLAKETVGELYAEGEKDDAFSFPIPFTIYMDGVSRAREGVGIIYSPMLKSRYRCIACNYDAIKNGRSLELYYILTENHVTEELCAVGEFKGNNPLARDQKMAEQGIMAYMIKGTNADSEKISRVKNGIIDVAAQNVHNKAPLTLNQIAVMTEALFEVDYHTHKALRRERPRLYIIRPLSLN